MPMGEYDKRLLLLTAENGKISAFAKGARRPGSNLLGATRLFAFGRFELYAGRSSYTVKAAEIKNYFEFLSEDPEAYCYASYFAEIADYFGQEGAEAEGALKTLYMALYSLGNAKLSRPLVRYTYELKMMQMEGEAPQAPPVELSESADRAWNYVMESPPEKCFFFLLEPDSFRNFSQAVADVRNRVIDRNFRSLKVLEDFLSLDV
jgi:DNA repair protein RecO (recombination protein O)